LRVAGKINVASILRLSKGGSVFDDALQIMGEAFDDACKSFTIPDNPIVYEVIAKRII